MLDFEDELTVRYQIQEMLRAERTFEEQGILDEIEAYAPLVPDGRNFKATMLIEYPEVVERRRELAKLIGIAERVWVQVEGCAKVFAIADEDLERDNEEKTSAVHFLRFELAEDMARALKAGANLSAGVDHANYRFSVDTVTATLRDALTRDLV
jgi:Protein of unknown function (DUF3501)